MQILHDQRPLLYLAAADGLGRLALTISATDMRGNWSLRLPLRLGTNRGDVAQPSGRRSIPQSSFRLNHIRQQF